MGTLLVSGCSRGPQIVPARGKVLYNGEPLKFGSVMFQPEGGQPARAVIQPDGTFVLTTENNGDGATVGTNRVRVTQYESQDPQRSHDPGGEIPLGRSLIPRRYTDYDTSGLVVEVKSSGNEPFVFELTDKRQ